jgi:hypothetical protein
MEQVWDDAAALAAKVRVLDTVGRDSISAVARVVSQDPETGVALLEASAPIVDLGDTLAKRQEIALLFQAAETDHAAITNWFGSLIEHGVLWGRNSTSKLAGYKLCDIEQTRPGAGRYNLSCLAAWEGNADEALHWLRAAASAGQEISRAQIAAEKDFDPIRDDPEFASYVQSLPENYR